MDGAWRREGAGVDRRVSGGWVMKWSQRQQYWIAMPAHAPVPAFACQDHDHDSCIPLLALDASSRFIIIHLDVISHRGEMNRSRPRWQCCLRTPRLAELAPFASVACSNASSSGALVARSLRTSLCYVPYLIISNKEGLV